MTSETFTATSLGIRLLVVYGINVLALIVVDWMFTSVSIGRWGSLLWGALILTIGNVFLKPILATVLSPTAAESAGPALASMLIYLLMAAVLAVRPAGLFPARG